MRRTPPAENQVAHRFKRKARMGEKSRIVINNDFIQDVYRFWKYILQKRDIVLTRTALLDWGGADSI